MNQVEEVSFIYTKNERLLDKFIKMRKDLYEQDSKFVGFRNFDDENIKSYQGDNHIVQLLMKGEECVGGGMLSLSSKEDRSDLPMEVDLNTGFSDKPYTLPKLLPELDLWYYNYVEASRMLVHPDYRDDPRYISTMFVNLYHRSLDEAARFFFAMTDRLRCRMYRKIASVHIRKLAYLLNHFDIPDQPFFEDVRMQVMA